MTPNPQAVEGVTYAHKLDKAEARLDWNDSASALERKVRAFDPWPVAEAHIGGERLRAAKTVRSDVLERLHLLAPIEHVRRGGHLLMPPLLRILLPQHEQSFRRRERERLQDHGVDGREDGGVGATADAGREHGQAGARAPGPVPSRRKTSFPPPRSWPVATASSITSAAKKRANNASSRKARSASAGT